MGDETPSLPIDAPSPSPRVTAHANPVLEKKPAVVKQRVQHKASASTMLRLARDNAVYMGEKAVYPIDKCAQCGSKTTLKVERRFCNGHCEQSWKVRNPAKAHTGATCAYRFCAEQGPAKICGRFCTEYCCKQQKKIDKKITAMLKQGLSVKEADAAISKPPVEASVDKACSFFGDTEAVPVVVKPAKPKNTNNNNNNDSLSNSKNNSKTTRSTESSGSLNTNNNSNGNITVATKQPPAKTTKSSDSDKSNSNTKEKK